MMDDLAAAALVLLLFGIFVLFPIWTTLTDIRDELRKLNRKEQD